MDAVLDGIAAVCRILTGASLVVLTVIFGWLVFGRYVLNATPTWVEQAALLLVMVIAFIGAAVGIHEHVHLSVTTLRSSVPPRVRSVLVAISDLLLCSLATPVTVVGVLYKRWQLPHVQLVCQLSGMVPVCLVFVSTLTITGIAMDR